MSTFQKYGLTILRIGLAILYLWFGFSQLFDGLNWVSWVPAWAVALVHMPPAMIVLGNGLFEVAMGSLLALGLWVRPVSFILSAHMALVTFDIGLTAIGMRDLTIAFSTLALAFLNERE